MRTTPVFTLLSLVQVPLLVACGTESGKLPSEPGPSITAQRSSTQWSEWSEPVNLGPPVNSPVVEQNPTLSPDELSLYFVSNRTDLPGAQGANDIWVSQRACLGCPWMTPVNLGPLVNSSSGDAGPNLSVDGHLLFFTSSRPDELGATDNDIYMSRRADPKDDFGWGPPVKLGPDVNSALAEFGPHFLASAEDGTANLYFQRGLAGGHPTNDIYYAAVTADGETRGPAVTVAELNDPTVADGSPTVRKDGREILFNSTRSGRLGSIDIWVSTRRSVHHAWSPPENLGTPVNIGGLPGVGSRDPDLSFDGRTLVFMSNRPGSVPRTDGAPSEDIWMSTRARAGDSHDQDDDDRAHRR